MTGTIHHDYCPECGNYTVDKIDNECKYAHCGDGYLEWLESYEEDNPNNIFDGTCEEDRW